MTESLILVSIRISVLVTKVTKITKITVYATLFMYYLLLEDAPLLRHVSVQFRTILRQHTCIWNYKKIFTKDSVVSDSISFL
jgi:hypothetical protein